MAIDCEQLSPNARKIFEKIILYFGKKGLDPWGKPVWKPEGIIHELGSPPYDLRTSADRQKLIDWYQRMIGHSVYLDADSYRKNHRSLQGFNRRRYSRLIQHWAELLVLLHDLGFQIETLDLVEETPSVAVAAESRPEPCPNCDSEFPEFDGWDCQKCGYKLPAKVRKAHPRIL